MCTSPVSIAFESITEVEISNVAIISCGSGNTHCALNVSLVQHFVFRNVTLFNSANVAFMVSDSNGLLSGSEFISNLGTGMKAINSTVTFEKFNTFLSNFAGGVAINDSTLNFDGLVTFSNNTARYGGGISAERSVINCC